MNSYLSVHKFLRSLNFDPGPHELRVNVEKDGKVIDNDIFNVEFITDGSDNYKINIHYRDLANCKVYLNFGVYGRYDTSDDTKIEYTEDEDLKIYHNNSVITLIQ